MMNMMSKRALSLCCILILAGSVAASADVFRFRYTRGEKYRIVSRIRESVYLNGQLSHESDILDKIAVTVTDTRGDAGDHDVLFQTSERAYGSRSTYDWSEEYASRFWRDARGAYAIDESYFMPMVRDVPLFPDTDMQPGAAWVSAGSEVHDFRANFGIARPFQFPITVSCRYLANERRDGIDCAVFTIDYEIFHDVGIQGTSAKGMYPVRVAGSSHQKYWWDRAGGRPLYDEESFRFIYTLNTGDQVEYAGDSEGRLIEAAPLDRERIAGDIRKQLEAEHLPDVSVASTEKGVTITLENVNFPPNSDTLLPPEQEKLRRIAQMLARYPDRDIAILGYTARASGYTEEEYQALSEKRARAAADFLLSIGARDAGQVTARGMGADSPLGDNSTEAGRRKNRRVEITILEN
jgi:outer membrane protein OmpA-like peptidoglycan-associated protein